MIFWLVLKLEINYKVMISWKILVDLIEKKIVNKIKDGNPSKESTRQMKTQVDTTQIILKTNNKKNQVKPYA
jgi:hypothetical protein